MRGSIRFGRRGMTVAAAALMTAGALFGVFGPGGGAAAANGGPVLVLGIDAEDGGPGGHGPIAVYETMVANVFANVTNGGSGILVFGADPGSSVTAFWDQIATDTGRTVTYADGAAAVTSASFAGQGVLVISSSFDETSGGLEDSENDALTGRSADIAAHVNGGGGLIVFEQNGLANPFGFFGGLGTLTGDDINTGADDDVDVNANGTAAGLSDDLDLCCWHQQFTAWPGFLVPLATYAGSTEVAGLGGAAVVIGPVTGGPTITLDPNATTEPPTTAPPMTEPPTTEPGTTTPGSTTPGSTAPGTTRPGGGVSPATGARPVSGRPTFTG